MLDRNKTNTIGYKIGFMLGIVLSLCLAAVLIGITVKFLFWLF